MRFLDVLMFYHLCQVFSITMFISILILTGGYDVSSKPRIRWTSVSSMLLFFNCVTLSYTLLALAFDRRYVKWIVRLENHLQTVTCGCTAALSLAMTGDPVVAVAIPLVVYTNVSRVVLGAACGMYSSHNILNGSASFLSVLVVLPFVFCKNHYNVHVREFGRLVALTLSIGCTTIVACMRSYDERALHGGLAQKQ